MGKDIRLSENAMWISACTARPHTIGAPENFVLFRIEISEGFMKHAGRNHNIGTHIIRMLTLCTFTQLQERKFKKYHQRCLNVELMVLQLIQQPFLLHPLGRKLH